MTDSTAPRAGGVRWGWWALTVLLGVALVVDVIDGALLKLATSVLLFVACGLAALVAPPRSGVVGGVIVVCVGGAVLLLLVRLFGPGL